jgi:hypothetical protein
MSLPAFWRVTVTWRRPPGFGKPRASGYLPYQFDHPHAFVRPFAGQLLDGTVEAAEMRTRTIRLTAVVPADEPQKQGQWPYASSAQLAINRVARAAHFGYCCHAGAEWEVPLPEPVRITVEPVTVDRTAAPVAARED